MNAGIIASRYAKAFLEYVQEYGTGKTVYSQVCKLCYYMHVLPQLKEYLEDSSNISQEQKENLLFLALEAPVDPSLMRFIRMVTARRRIEYFSRMLLSFIEQYRQVNNIKVGQVVTAVPSDGLGGTLEKLFQDTTGAEVYFDERVDPEIIGGFILEFDGLRLDASVQNHLERIRRRLVEKNNRIV